MQKINRLLLPIVILPVLLVTAVPLAEAQTIYGFAGKPWDPDTGLSNFGYRDYNPQTGRFTTQDPIRDGTNWYSYAYQNPVNYGDRLGLKNAFMLSKYRMNNGEWAGVNLTGDTDIIGLSGCAATLVSNLLTTVVTDTNPGKVNDTYVHDGKVYWSEVAAQNNMNVTTYDSYSAAQYQKQEEDIYNNYYTGIKVHYNDGGGTHWVGANGIEVRDDITYFVVSPTSINDEVKGISNRINSGWIIEDDKVLVPESAVFGAVVFTQEKTF